MHLKNIVVHFATNEQSSLQLLHVVRDVHGARHSLYIRLRPVLEGGRGSCVFYSLLTSSGRPVQNLGLFSISGVPSVDIIFEIYITTISLHYK